MKESPDIPQQRYFAKDPQGAMVIARDIMKQLTIIMMKEATPQELAEARENQMTGVTLQIALFKTQNDLAQCLLEKTFRKRIFLYGPARDTLPDVMGPVPLRILTREAPSTALDIDSSLLQQGRMSEPKSDFLKNRQAWKNPLWYDDNEDFTD